jgi:hypothetical protein
VTPEPATSVRFVPQGRYGHAAADGEDFVELPAIGVVDALQNVLEREGRIDLMKIDTEGSELDLLAALRSDPVMAKVGSVVYEDNRGHTRWARSGGRSR